MATHPPTDADPPTMIDVDEAQRIIAETVEPLPAVEKPLADAMHRTLVAAVCCDLDYPPFDRSLMDGYAVRSTDCGDGETRLRFLEEIVAGATPSRPVAPGTASRVMTGAPLPEGADAVVIVERTDFIRGAGQDADGDHDALVVVKDHVAAGQNIMTQGTSLRRDQRVLERGTTLRAVEVGILAEVGRVEVLVVPRPTVAVLATGNELVPPEQHPAHGQIRNSNGPMLAACVAAAGGLAAPLGAARDDPADLRERIGRGLDSDVLVLSGGVSAGVLDLVPGVLEELGVEQVFHKVRLKPGKPIWFGIQPHAAGPRLVFGLPGNPVSSFVCFELFVRPAIRSLAAAADPSPELRTAKLTVAHAIRGDRPTYHPGVLSRGNSGAVAAPLAWHGSADLFALSRANALLHFPTGPRKYEAGSLVEYLPI